MTDFLSNSRTTAFLTATILSGGALVVWGFAAGFIGIIQVESWSRQQLNESLDVTYVGRPMIRVYPHGQMNEEPVHQTLERQPIAPQDLFPERRLPARPGRELLTFIYPASLPTGEWKPSTDELARGLIFSYSDGKTPAKYWYLIREAGTTAHAYFAGFDSKTRESIGYLGTGGLRFDIPPLEEQFDVGDRSLHLVATTVYVAIGRQPNAWSPRGESQLVAVMSGDQLYLIDLRNQSVRHVPVDEPVGSIGIFREPLESDDDLEETLRAVARTKDHLLVFDRDGQMLRKIAIPSHLADKELALYLPLGKEVLLVDNQHGRGTVPNDDDSEPRRTELYWVDAENHVTRHESVVLSQARDLSKPFIWLIHCLVPSPGVLGGFLYGFLPWVSATEEHTAAQMRATMWNHSWPIFVPICLLSMALAVVAYRRHRRYENHGAAFWAIFVFLLGPAGYFGYLVHRRWPARETCSACGKRVPCDRETCLNCRTEFPTPALIGGEVFA